MVNKESQTILELPNRFIMIQRFRLNYHITTLISCRRLILRISTTITLEQTSQILLSYILAFLKFLIQHFFDFVDFILIHRKFQIFATYRHHLFFDNLDQFIPFYCLVITSGYISTSWVIYFCLICKHIIKVTQLFKIFGLSTIVTTVYDIALHFLL